MQAHVSVCLLTVAAGYGNLEDEWWEQRLGWRSNASTASHLLLLYLEEHCEPSRRSNLAQQRPLEEFRAAASQQPAVCLQVHSEHMLDAYAYRCTQSICLIRMLTGALRAYA
jgi:hypothetical protein